MARTLRDAKLDTRNARSRLKARREPYWRSLSEGLAIGYRKGAKGGTWIAKLYSAEHGRRYQAIGTADDVADADGEHVLSFGQAQGSARRWVGELAREEDAGEPRIGPYDVSAALDDYLKDLERRGAKGMSQARNAIDRHIRPALGDTLLSRLTTEHIEAWQHGIATTPPLVRVKSPKAGQAADMRADKAPARGRRTTTKAETKKLTGRPFDPKSPDAIRKRRSTSNRLLTVLKAALNLAYRRRKITSPHAWQSAKPYRGVDTAKVRYLTDAEAQRLVKAAPADLRAVATAALLTGARYGELGALRAGDFNPDAGTLHIAESKSGKPRHIVLTDEGRRFFVDACAGKAGDTRLFTQASGEPWGKSHQFRPMRDACAVAKITPAISFHILRHTYASRLARNSVPMAVIAQQLGHADTRMTEKHYAHLAAGYVSETVRAAFGSMGIVPERNVVSLGTAR